MLGELPNRRTGGRVLLLPSGSWGAAQTVNLEPVAMFYGGVGIAYALDGTLYVAYGGGGNGEEGDDSLFLVASADGGATWSQPAPLPQRGSVAP